MLPLLDLPPAVVVHYWRHYQQETEECGTVVEALRYAASLEEAEAGLVDRFELADGTVLDEKALEPWVWLFENEWHGYGPTNERGWVLLTDWDGTMTGKPVRSLVPEPPGDHQG
jgi:hypothetical protein